MQSLRGILLLASVCLVSACNLTDEFSAEEPSGAVAAYSGGAEDYFRQTPAGTVLTTPEGMTVYTYNKEIPGSPSCYGRCTEDWSPVIAPTDGKKLGDLTLLKRIDGSQQWAYRNLALYTYRGDQAPGDIKGDNADEGAWHVVTAKQ